MSIFSPYVLIGIVVAVLAAYGGGRLQQYTRDQAIFQKKMDAAIAAAEAEKTRIEKARDAERLAAEVRQQELTRERDRQVVRAQKRIQELDAAVAVLRAPGIGKLLNDTIDEAGRPAGTAAKSDQGAAPATAGADTSVGLWAQWSVSVIALYSACRDQVIGWNQFYGGLRGAK